ncbi:head-tail adaptor protein [Catalinimonas sp. 4WD22]|uniref:head-tail adaptor protein n=1 Tax=Catalinimonas locisalis TaxID=3133978 RepID=UPI0031018B9E
MSASRLRERITFQQIVTKADSTGGLLPSKEPFNNQYSQDFNREEPWVDILTTYAEVESAKGDRYLLLGQILQGKPYDVTIRYRSDFVTLDEIKPSTLQTKFRILFKNKELYIHSVDNRDERNKWYDIVCFEKTGGIKKR